MGRDYITRVAVDIQIDAGATAIAELLLDWFPRLSQVFRLCSARLAPASQSCGFSSLTSASSSRRWTWPKPPRCLRQPDPVVIESASTKSCPIITFREENPRGMISCDLFIRVQGLEAKVRASVPPKDWHYLTDSFHGCESIPFFFFERDDRLQVIRTGGSLNREEGRYPCSSGHALKV